MSILQKINEKSLDPELQFQATRSGGPGGQNVNKVNSKIILKFNVLQSQILTEEEKALLMKKWAKKLDSEGELTMQTQEKRSQLQNKTIAISKFYELLKRAFHKRKIRKATKPGKGAIERRLKAKKIRSEKKQRRINDWKG